MANLILPHAPLTYLHHALLAYLHHALLAIKWANN
ncbi:hypothetical protein E9G_08105 [Moraxella catarrhalis 7169]|nr:hypothetical protein E9G_08105 [Moraxella catarrhalis 7169]